MATVGGCQAVTNCAPVLDEKLYDFDCWLLIPNSNHFRSAAAGLPAYW